MSYFRTLFEITKKRPRSLADLRLHGDIHMNDSNELCRIPSCEKIESVVKSMHPTKAPGPDGLLALFYQSGWPTVKEDITQVFHEIFLSGTFSARLNHTNLMHIHKKKEYSPLADFRPIALCNVIYKVVTKILANRLRLLLCKLISPNQDVFVTWSKYLTILW